MPLKGPLTNTELEFASNQPRLCDNYLFRLRIKPKKRDIAGLVYYILCQVSGIIQYIGETERSLKSRFLEHCRPSSTSSEVSQHIHIESPGHHINLDEVKILEREPYYFKRGVKEAIHIRVNKPSLNRNGGRYKLPRVYDPLLESQVRKVTCSSSESLC
ncbi:hypothetical protein HOLleu_20618 [Holothuria leucospilota]|uniref:GIY-YIG domain-containing protein n=1 Tax=Holothuria leucospilota TaxID=206669 RepID=A0A9Q1H8L2_HOLLE|nr:hypothetical protein HOLleu_20618 [Holothuria leucospilota]